jgi:hypothetical protein
MDRHQQGRIGRLLTLIGTVLGIGLAGTARFLSKCACPHACIDSDLRRLRVG